MKTNSMSDMAAVKVWWLYTTSHHVEDLDKKTDMIAVKSLI